MIRQQIEKEVAGKSWEGHWSGHKLLQGLSTTMPELQVRPVAVGGTKDKCERLNSGAT